jgi:hypothetical protein
MNNMSVFILRVRTAWEDYFPGSSPSQTYATTKYTTTQSSSSTNVFVLNCLFIGCTSTSNGGALFCSSSVQRLLIESTSFFSCSTSNNYGGAIFFQNTNSGESVLYKVCSNDCCSTYTSSSYGQFAYIYMQNSASSKNYIDYSSISRCVNHNTNSHHLFVLGYGKVYCPSINVSMNKCYSRSGIFCPATADSNIITCIILYSSFTDNIAIAYTCFSQDRTATKAEMKCCNILRNTQGSPNSEGTIRFDGHSTVKDSCILMNDATYTFWAYSSYVITVFNCTVDSTSHYNSLVLTNTVTKSFIHALNHLSTQNCASEYDSAGTLTIIGTPTKKIFRHTCNYNCHSRISDLFSLTYLFMVTFIYLNPSS